MTQEQSVDPPPRPPPGWFPDPWDARRIRWWSGIDWSDRTEVSPGWQSGPLPIVVVDGRPIPLSGWWRRAGGLIIDDLILGASLYALWIILDLVIYSHPAGLVAWGGGQIATGGPRVATILSTVLVSMTYQMVLLGWRGQTLGMMAVGTKAVDRSGGRLSTDRVVRRVVLAFLLTSFWSSLNSVISILYSPNPSPHGFHILSLIFLCSSLATFLWPIKSPLNQTLFDKGAGCVVMTTR